MFKIPFEVYQFLMLIGFPGAFVAFARVLLSRIKKIDIENRALQKGVQALLRKELYDLYNKYNEQGYAPLYVKENFRNMYEQYHALGINGVMDSLYEKFIDLPETEKERNSIC